MGQGRPSEPAKGDLLVLTLCLGGTGLCVRLDEYSSGRGFLLMKNPPQLILHTGEDLVRMGCGAIKQCMGFCKDEQQVLPKLSCLLVS